VSERSLMVFETLTSRQPFRVDPATLLGGANTVIMADPRKGKSYTAAKACEELGRLGLPFVIIDPEGEYYSLREKYVVLVVGVQKEENCDVNVGVEHAELLVGQFLDNRIPMILDLSSPDLEEEDAHLFLAEFMKALILREARLRMPCLVVIDEADEYIPERGHKTRGPDYEQFSKLVKKGGKRGIGTVVISHRPTWVAKDLLAKCQNWILLSQTFRPDLDRLVDLTRIDRQALLRLKGRSEGECLLYGAFTGERVVWARCLPRETTHVGTTPEVEPEFVERPELEKVIASFQEDLLRLTERRRTERSEVERLQDQMAELRRELGQKDKELEMFRTARVAAGMIDVPGAPSPQPATNMVSIERYRELEERVHALERDLAESNLKLESLPEPKVGFTIDKFGTVTTLYPWLTRLIDLSRIKAVIVKMLMESKGLTAEQIALDTGFYVGTVRSHLHELKKRGVVRTSEGKPYRYFLREA